MDRNATDPLARLGAGGASVHEEALAPGLARLRLASRAPERLGFPVYAYLLDGLLIDTGFAHARPALVRALEGRGLVGVALTHHHEDHAGAAGAVAARHGCPVYLRDPAARWSEGVGALPRYRRLFWGWVAPYEPGAMPATLSTGPRSLRCVPTGGHSRTHTAFFEPEQGVLFTGDLLVARGASAVMRHEDPYESLASLRTVEALGARRILPSHSDPIDDPQAALRRKIEHLEGAIRQVLDLHARGLEVAAIRRRVFPRGAWADFGGALMTEGEFSRAAFVRAVIARRDAYHSSRAATPAAPTVGNSVTRSRENPRSFQ
jgi:glyoxylase-like metal-dependent hydrolase (beta-lactamase superfamily II)